MFIGAKNKVEEGTKQKRTIESKEVGERERPPCR